ncbi:MAG: RNA methyltransferase [Chloroflexota bacterium]|nr:RNA methyltransferase [Chloroflexota bacterium]
MPETITSSSNRKIKLVRALQTRSRKRHAEAAFVAEGVRLLEEAIAAAWPVRFVLYDESLSERGKALIRAFEAQQNIDVAEITIERMAEIADTETPQGILAVLERQPLPLPDKPTFLVIADQIRDPGNLGTLLRTANAAGVNAVYVTPGTVDAYAPKVIRSGMGAHFHLPIEEHSGDTLQVLLKDLPIFVAKIEGGTPLWEANLHQPCALLIGGEAFGPSSLGKTMAKYSVTIPMPGGAESLNAAVAAGILITEVLRQRYQSKEE